MSSSSFVNYSSGKYINANKIIFVIDGSISVLNEYDEIIRSYSSGFIGLNIIFPDTRKWNCYRLVCDTNVSILSIDSDYFMKIITNYSALTEYFQQEAKKLDLLLLHHKVTKNCLVTRVNLLSYLPQLKQVLFDPGIVRGNFFLQNNDFLILHNGTLIHDSGKEIFPGQIYECSSLPSNGDWLSLDHSCLFILESEELEGDDPGKDSFEVEEEAVLNTFSFILNADNSKTIDRVFPPKKNKLTHRTFLQRLKLMWLRLMWRNLWKNYPIYLQKSNNEPGIACLIMIGHFWRKDLNYSRLLKIAKTDRHGSSLLDLVDGGEFLGFSVLPGTSDLSNLKNSDLPVIAHCNSNHYVVVYEVSKSHVVIGDPRIGIKHLTRAEFCQTWTGYTLWIFPTAEFLQAESTFTFFSKFFKILRPHQRDLLGIFVILLLFSFLV